MRRLALLAAAAAAFAAAVPAADAQTRRRVVVAPEGGLVLNVRPRSYLDPGNVVQPGSLREYVNASSRSYLTNPPWINQRDRFGEGTLPDPITGPFVGARNPFGPVDFSGQGLQ